MKKTSIKNSISEEELQKLLKPYLDGHKKRMAGKRTTYNGAIYARLSEKEINKLKKKNQSVSSSIISQVVMLIRKAEELMILVDAIFIDDGFSGQQYDNRPQFMKLIAYLKLKKANTVLTKNISRLGRDMRMTLEYFQCFFPQNNIRYVADDDDYDSLRDDPTDPRWLDKMKENDALSRTISKNVKSGKKARAIDGNFMAVYAPFGYKKSLEDYNRLVPDEDTRGIVVEIFELLAKGVLPSDIAIKFNEQNVTYPSEAVGNKHTRKTDEDRGWSTNVIKRIAQNHVYLGHLVMGKTESESYKTKKVKPVPKEDWIVVENTHEAIVNQELFDEANRYIASRTCARSNSYSWLLQGLVFCADCGSTMSLTTYKNKKGKKIHYLRCNKYSVPGRLKLCTPHAHKMETVEKIVIDEIRDRCKQYIQQVDYEKLISEADKELGIWCKNKENEIKTLKRECELINDKIASLYDDWKNSFLTENDYKRLYDRYNTNRKSKEMRIKELENKKIEETKLINTTNFIKEFMDLKEITREYIVKMVDFIKLKERDPLPNCNNNKKVDTKPSDIHIKFKISILNDLELLQGQNVVNF